MQYSRVGPELNQYDEDCALRELQYYLEEGHDNCLNYDVINYERLIYIEEFFSDNEEIRGMLHDLKHIICENYVQRQLLISRLLLQDHETPI